MKTVCPAMSWLFSWQREVHVIPHSPRGARSQFYPLDPIEAVLEPSDACGYPAHWRQHDRRGKPI
ncbi:hypothetical protein SAT01_29440 [Sinomonas atrocyanea]|nr:hypothetical protein SAT01_29440 [Sinomonas atrocyanea]GGG82266.1 hypothetical protein GCM10007172_39790 [Sinomonas atrocyanea]